MRVAGRAGVTLAVVLGAALVAPVVSPGAARAGWTLLLLPPRAPAPPADAPAEAVEKHRTSPFDAKAPLDQWTPVAVYTSPEDCEKGRRERMTRITERVKGKADAKKPPPSPERLARVTAAHDLARCVSIHEKGLP